MHSGGGSKEPPYEKIYIEAPEDEAKVIFYNRFDHAPDRVSCTCCGEDYSVSEHETLERATAYERGCAWVYFRPNGTECDQSEAMRGQKMRDGYSSGYAEREDTKWSWSKCLTLEDYLKKNDVLVIYAHEIKPEERVGEVPREGYVWL